mmetsp:Transcript_6464/g.26183  ORF Transcript_6464/g.26183 Transcript_6464/m.26183 type:complete len:275 (+) Transcript_6464:218-1042(+)
MPCMKRRMQVCSVYILLALGAVSLGLSGVNPFNQMAVKGVLKLQLPVRTEQPQFDTISKRAYRLSLVQHEVEITDGDRNVTWERGSGGLDDADRSLMLKLYSSTRSVFEWGLGESTRIASALNVARYSGIDSDASYVSTCRNDSPTHFKFYFADIGHTERWGVPTDKNLPKQTMQYQVDPLLSEPFSFDVYLVDGRYRVACVCLAFLHAEKFGATDVIVLMHDYGARPQYHVVEQFAYIFERSSSGQLVALKRNATSSAEIIVQVWEEYAKVVG